MTQFPHFALRGLYRQAGAAIGLAARLGKSETLASALFVELDRHPLVVPSAFERLAAGVDPATPLQRALMRIARVGPRRTAERSVREHGPKTDAGTVSRNAEATAAGNDVAADLAGRVLEMLNAAAPDSATSARGPQHTPARRQTETDARSTVSHAGGRGSISSLMTAATAREAFATLIERAGPGSDFPIQSPGYQAGLLADLIAGRMVSTALLIGATVPDEASVQRDEPSGAPLTLSSARLVAVLDRVDARRRALRERRPLEKTIGSAANTELAGRVDTHMDLELTGPRNTGLRRLAMRAGGGVRSVGNDLDARQTSQARGEWSGAHRGMTALPATDDDLARRIADILAREVRRHGVEAGAIEP